MNNWQSLPEELQLTDEQIKSLSIQDVSKLFKLAQAHNVSDRFSDLFWDALSRVSNHADAHSIQSVVDQLESRKRSLGRQYSKLKSKYTDAILARYIAVKYNDIEYNIRWLVNEYHCTRKSKQHLLEV